MPSRAIISSLALLGSALVACGDDGGGGLVIVSEGTGPTNTRPLWEPRPGPLFPGSPYVMGEERLVDGRRVFAAGYPRPTLESGYGPAEPYFMRIYARKDDGIWLEGDTRAGLYEDPVLFVPAAVRVGMVWTHGARWRFEVLGHNPTADPPVWVIQVLDHERMTTDQANTEVLFGVPYTITYYEGTPVGPFAGVEQAWLAQDEVVRDAPPEVPALALAPLNDGEPIAEGIVPTFVGAVVGPDDRVRLTVDGLSVSLENSGFTGAFFVGGEATACGAYDRALDRIADIDEGDCRDPRASVVTDDGIKAIANRRWGRHYYCVPGVSPEGIPTCNPESLAMAGIFLAADGTAMVLRGGQPLSVAPHVGEGRMGEFGALVDAAWTSFTGPLPPELWSRLWLVEEGAEGYSVLQVEDHALQVAHVTRAGELTAPRPLHDEGGNLGLVSDRQGRRLLRTHPDGTIERLTWDEDGLHRVAIGTIGLARDRLLVGALDLGDRLWVVTLEGFAGTDPQYDISSHTGSGTVNVGADRAVRPELGRLMLWEARGATAAVPREDSLLTRLDAAIAGGDAALCGFDGEAPRDGWTIADAPAIAFENRPGCVTVVGDKARTTNRRHVRGRLPEIGAFTLSLEAVDPDASDVGAIFAGGHPWEGARPRVGGGYAVCADGAEPCGRWRLYDDAWRETGEQAEAPDLAPLPDAETCTTAAGASCRVTANALLDCRGPGAPGPEILPDYRPNSWGVFPPWRLERCWVVEDTLWVLLNQLLDVGGERRLLWQVDTTTWTHTPAPIDADAFVDATIDPEGQHALFFHDGSVMVELGAASLTRYTLAFDVGVGVFAGPLLVGTREGATWRLWRPDLAWDRPATCGDGVYDVHERCPEDAVCEPADAVCDGDVIDRCHDRGDARVPVADCATVCENGACHGTGERCFEAACVPMVACGEVICAPGEVCAHAACTRLTRCGDGLCQPEEDAASCVDCRGPSLTDGVCIYAEIGSSDCAICGDGACDDLEAERCPEDCADCGDGTCAPGERCRADCPGCGNGICDGDEPYPDLATHCPLDCLPCEPGRDGCFRGGTVTCAADGSIASYTPGACE